MGRAQRWRGGGRMRWEAPNAEPRNSEPEGSHRPVAFLYSSLPLLAFRSLRAGSVPSEHRCVAFLLQYRAIMAARVCPELLTRPPRHGINRGTQVGRILSGEPPLK